MRPNEHVPDPAVSLRVRVHLNLNKPERAENAVRVKTGAGGWQTVAYATELLLADCVPVVDLKAQDLIRLGGTHKIPHAFIEGTLVHFRGRVREKAPPALVRDAQPFLVASRAFEAECEAIFRDQVPINYNPRFARCFYRDTAKREEIAEKLESCRKMAVLGWNFWARAAVFQLMGPADYCEAKALTLTSASEKLAMRRGRETTQRMMMGEDAASARRPRPRA